MTEQETNHPTQGRRRRHKSPASMPSAPSIPAPRLADHLDTFVSNTKVKLDDDNDRRGEPKTPRDGVK